MTILENFEYEVIDDPEELGRFYQEFGNPDVIGWDYETTGLDQMRDEVHGLGIANASKGWYITGPALGASEPWFIDRMEDSSILKLAHNAKFDLHFLTRRNPQVLPANIGDTMIAQWLVDENQSKKLKKMAYQYFGIKGLPEYKDLLKETKSRIGVSRMDQVSIHDIELDRLGKYASMDAWFLPPLWERLQPKLRSDSQLSYYHDTAIPYIWTILRMEKNGFYIDQQRLQELKVEWETKLEELEERWNEITGGVNYRSPQQLQEWFYDEVDVYTGRTTKSGNPSTDSISIQRMVSQDDTGSAEILQHIKELDKLLNTYLYSFEKDTINGYLYGSFKQGGTVTGRLASADPNLQNIPVHGQEGSKMREVFSVEPGEVMVVVDYSQVELRIVAHYSQDPTLMEIFHDPDGDPHQTTADLVEVDRNKVAKHLNFAWLYGTSAKTFCDTVEKKGYDRPDPNDAEKWMGMFEEAYPDLVEWRDDVHRWARKLGYVKTIEGRRRRLPEISSYNKYYRSRAERQAFNAVIQGSAGDLITWAMLELDKVLDFYGAKMLAQVHDELVFRCPEKSVDSFVPVVKAKMEAVEDHYNISVPIIAEPNVGKNWAEAK